MRILVADDLEDTRCVLKLLLEMKGHAVLEAENGRVAVECALKERPDLILMDLNMPIMDGLDATQRIRENSSTALIPIVVLSSHMDDAVWRDRALRCGCNACYSKPLDFDGLEDLLTVASTPH